MSAIWPWLYKSAHNVFVLSTLQGDDLAVVIAKEEDVRLMSAAPALLAEVRETLALILRAQRDGAGGRGVTFEEWAMRVDGLRAIIAQAETVE